MPQAPPRPKTQWELEEELARSFQRDYYSRAPRPTEGADSAHFESPDGRWHAAAVYYPETEEYRWLGFERLADGTFRRMGKVLHRTPSDAILSLAGLAVRRMRQEAEAEGGGA